MKKFVLAALLAAASVSANATALLVNGSFETGNFNGWTVGGGALPSGVAANGAYIGNYDFGSAYAVAADGAYTAWYGGNGYQTFTLTQTVTIAGGTYDFGITVNADNANYPGPYGGNNHLYIGGADYSLANAVPATTTNSATLAAGTYTLQYTFANSGTASAGWSIDNLFFNSQADEGPAAVPEPAMLGLFGMGAVALGLSRRRKTA